MIIYKTNDELIVNLLFMYCEGKGVIWRIFFGWRGTAGEMTTFKVSRKACHLAETTAHFLRDYAKANGGKI